MRTIQIGTYDEPTVIPALSSITRQQAAFITQAVRRHGADWTACIDHDYDGHLAILVEPVHRSARHTSYYVCGTSTRLEFVAVHDDAMTTIGSYDNVDELATQLSHTLACDSYVAV